MELAAGDAVSAGLPLLAPQVKRERERERGHLEALAAAALAKDGASEEGRGEGEARARRGGQEGSRRRERAARVKVVACRRWLGRRGRRKKDVAERLGLSERTSRHWDHRWREDRLAGWPVGRPRERCSAEQGEKVEAVLRAAGPCVGMPALRGKFPEVPPAALCDQLLRYRRAWLEENGQVVVRELTWLKPGAVWAADFTDAESLVDGEHRYLMAVRDLAAQEQLVWRPAPAKEAWVVVGALAEQVAEHGAPLALKTDRGLYSEALREKAEEWGMEILLSPGGMPRYNGSVEAGIGAMKTRTSWQAIRAGQPGFWTSAGAEEARRQANELGRPWGPLCPTPDQAWAQREPLGAEERRIFRDIVKMREEILLDNLLKVHYYYYPWARVNDRDREVARRRGIVQALVALGYLEIRSRVRMIKLPIKGKRAAGAS